MKRKILAIVMTFAMIVGLMPMMAFATTEHRIEIKQVSSFAGGVATLNNGVTVSANPEIVKNTGETQTHYETESVQDDSTIVLNFTVPSGKTITSAKLDGNAISIVNNSYTYTAKSEDKEVLELDDVTISDTSTQEGAYIIWKGENDEICKHHFLNVKQTDNSQVTYIPEANVVDDDDKSKKFVVSEMAQHDDEWYHWVKEDKITTITGKYSTWTALTADYEEVKKTGAVINPCNSKNGQHSVCTFGDRSFKATIYDNDFVGVKFSDEKDDYQYFPDYWDPTFFLSTVDVSGSTVDNPINYTSPFCEDTIKLSAVDPTGSSQSDRIVISDIRPMVEQPGSAFDISEAAGVWSIHFNSNFYSQVEFEIDVTNNEDSQNPVTNTYYIRINREAIKVMDIQAKEFYANFYYANDVGTTYEDYDVYMEIIYSDGTRTLEKVDASQTIINDQSETIGSNYAVLGGKNLNMSQYKIPIATDKQAERVIFTVTKAGATSIESDTFVGGYMGVGAGLEYDVESRTIIY